MMPQEPLLCWDLDRNFPKHIWARIVSRRVSFFILSPSIAAAIGYAAWKGRPKSFGPRNVRDGVCRHGVAAKQIQSQFPRQPRCCGRRLTACCSRRDPGFDNMVHQAPCPLREGKMISKATF